MYEQFVDNALASSHIGTAGIVIMFWLILFFSQLDSF
jgi:hypothetical protein